MLTAVEASAEQQAIKGTVSGEAIQKVGFRAMIQKQAIMYDLAGAARNVSDGTVSISLQGDKDRIEKALEAIRVGSKNSLAKQQRQCGRCALDASFNTFTVYGWTSTSQTSPTLTTWFFNCDPPTTRSPKKRPGPLGTRSPKAP